MKYSIARTEFTVLQVALAGSAILQAGLTAASTILQVLLGSTAASAI